MQPSTLLILAFLLGCRSGQSPTAGDQISTGQVSGEGVPNSGQGQGTSAAEEVFGQDAFPEPELEIIATGLEVPWGMDLLPDGHLLVAERNGRITRIDPATGKQTELTRRQALDQGEGGLLGLVLDPDFPSTHPYLYVYETVAEGNRIVRLRLQGDNLREDRVLLSGIPKARFHNGGVLRFGPDGYLYVGTGDGRDPSSAQDPNSLAGKILRMTRDGGAVVGTDAGGTAEQAAGSQTSAPKPASLVYSLGHRNVQGLAWDAQGQLYATEHGPSGEINGWCCHDEVNRITAGGNYGWPHVIGDQTRQGCLPPLAHSGQDTWAPGGCAVLGGSTGSAGSAGDAGSSSAALAGSSAIAWGASQGGLLVAGLRGQHLLLFDLETGKIRAVWFQDRLGRLRNVLSAPDGSVYFFSSNRDGRGSPKDGDDKLYRIKPKAN